MARPTVALLTDFGLRDHYAGAMKGVILTICPDVTIVDVTHEIPAHDIVAGALELAGCYRYFPAGTIFLVVVDPGVGSSRRGIGAQCGDYRFVAPDNGVLGAVFADRAPAKVVSLTDRRYARPTVSRTFEGRDRFAPAAAWLARGVEVSALGTPLREPVRLDIPTAQLDGDVASGRVLRVDRFGNLVTNIPRAMVEQLLAAGPIEIHVHGQRVPSLVETYASVGAGAVCAMFGSGDTLEIAVNGGHAAERLGVGRGAGVEVARPATAVVP